MTLEEIMKAVEALPADELSMLKTHIQEREKQFQSRKKIDMSVVREAIAEIQEGLSEQEIREIVAAMNEEYIEPDDADWAVD